MRPCGVRSGTAFFSGPAVLTFEGDPHFVGAPRKAAVVGVEPCHMSCAVAAGDGALGLPLLRPRRIYRETKREMRLVIAVPVPFNSVALQGDARLLLGFVVVNIFLALPWRGPSTKTCGNIKRFQFSWFLKQRLTQGKGALKYKVALKSCQATDCSDSLVMKKRFHAKGCTGS